MKPKGMIDAHAARACPLPSSPLTTMSPAEPALPLSQALSLVRVRLREKRGEAPTYLPVSYLPLRLLAPPPEPLDLPLSPPR